MAVNRRNPRGLPRGFQLDNFNSQLENIVALKTVVFCIIDDSQNVTVGAVVILLQKDPSICIVLTDQQWRSLQPEKSDPEKNLPYLPACRR